MKKISADPLRQWCGDCQEATASRWCNWCQEFVCATAGCHPTDAQHALEELYAQEEGDWP